MQRQRRGHGWRRGRGLRRGQIARLAEPCMLLLLQEGDRHGYELIAGLKRYGLDPEALDSGQLYRILRQMEDSGWVTSSWDQGKAGPARRVYSITEEGQRALTLWREELCKTRDVLHKILGLDD